MLTVGELLDQLAKQPREREVYGLHEGAPVELFTMDEVPVTDKRGDDIDAIIIIS